MTLDSAAAPHTCPRCRGEKGGIVFWDGPHASGTRWDPCGLCAGSGWVDDATLARFECGRKLRQERVAAGISLRERARAMGVSPSRLSDIEHGRAEP